MLRLVRSVGPRAARLADAEPLFVRNETNANRRYPYRRQIVAGGEELTLLYRLSGWAGIADSTDVARQRTLFSWLRRQEETIGALRFDQVDLDFWATNGDVFLTLDAESHELMKLAEVLTPGWEDVATEVGSYGPIVEFQGVWMKHAYANGALWLPAAQHFLTTTLRKRSLLVLQAFPLEYEGRVHESRPTERGFERRRRALMRLYARLLGVQPFPGDAGADGWMWRIRPDLEDLIDPPAGA
jgi:hypothetical protein